MKQATRDWMKACNVRFEYISKLDNGSVGGQVDRRLTFAVRQFQSNGEFAAMAFFPNDPPIKRKVLLDYTFFSMQESKVGVLRHELGHILGFRHEHIWTNLAGCPNEQIVEDYLGAELISQTADCRSVMHYICGGCGTYNMELSDDDKKSASDTYGASTFRF